MPFHCKIDWVKPKNSQISKAFLRSLGNFWSVLVVAYSVTILFAVHNVNYELRTQVEKKNPGHSTNFRLGDDQWRTCIIKLNHGPRSKKHLGHTVNYRLDNRQCHFQDFLKNLSLIEVSSSSRYDIRL